MMTAHDKRSEFSCDGDADGDSELEGDRFGCSGDCDGDGFGHCDVCSDECFCDGGCDGSGDCCGRLARLACSDTAWWTLAERIPWQFLVHPLSLYI